MATVQQIRKMLGLQGYGYGLGKLGNENLQSLYSGLGSSGNGIPTNLQGTLNNKLTTAINSYYGNQNTDKPSGLGRPEDFNNDGSLIYPTPAPERQPTDIVAVDPDPTKSRYIAPQPPQGNDATQTPSYLTLNDLNGWWTTAQADLSSLYGNNNNNGGGTQDYTQGLSTLYPRVDWGNYQTNNRGSRYFNSNTGTYGNNNMDGNISL